FVRKSVVFRFHRGLAAFQGGFALWYASLTPLHFALGDVIRRLRKARRANTSEANQGETEDNEGNQGSGGERRGELLRARDAEMVNVSGVAELRPPKQLH